MHDVNGISIASCQDIITSASCMHNISQSYASVMPNWLTDAFFNPDLQRQRLNTHQYSENDNVQTMRKMDNLHLADFVELQLKSRNDFDAAYDIEVKLINFLRLCVLESIKNIVCMIIPHIHIHPLLVLTRRKAWK